MVGGEKVSFCVGWLVGLGLGLGACWVREARGANQKEEEEDEEEEEEGKDSQGSFWEKMDEPIWRSRLKRQSIRRRWSICQY